MMNKKRTDARNTGFRWRLLPALPLLIMASLSLQAADVDTLLKAEKDKTSAAQASQKRVDALADQADELFQAFKQVNKQIENLQVYNAQLEAQLADQRSTLADLASSIDSAAQMERQLAPLTLNMIASLEQFVALDMPFLVEERQARLERLRSNQTRADLSSAEKFRQVLEAYKIESEYGTRIDSYPETLEIDGQRREVNILRVGRIALLYQTADQQVTAVWDKQAKNWLQLEGSDYRQAVAQGIRIARRQAAVDLLQLPIPAPEVVQ